MVLSEPPEHKQPAISALTYHSATKENMTQSKTTPCWTDRLSGFIGRISSSKRRKVNQKPRYLLIERTDRRRAGRFFDRQPDRHHCR